MLNWTARLALALLVCGLAASSALAAAPESPPAAAAPAPAAAAAVPFAFADFTWMNGNARTKDSPLDTKAFTGEFRVDTSYIFDFAHPSDHTYRVPQRLKSD